MKTCFKSSIINIELLLISSLSMCYCNYDRRVEKEWHQRSESHTAEWKLALPASERMRSWHCFRCTVKDWTVLRWLQTGEGEGRTQLPLDRQFISPVEERAVLRLLKTGDRMRANSPSSRSNAPKECSNGYRIQNERMEPVTRGL